MTFYNLYKKLSNLYPDSLRCEWDNDGIMCASDVNKTVNKVLISLDVTLKTVEYAKENGFDTIISHHPLVFKSQKSLTPANFTQNKLIELVKANIGVMSFHTRLDASTNGVNDILCKILNLSNIEKDSCDPIGRIGYLKEEISLHDFAIDVKNALNSPFVLYSGKLPVNKIYVVGGDGKDLIENAINLGCDTIITGRGSYNTSIDACDMGINIVEAGHFFTENPVCFELKKQVLNILPEITVEVFNSNNIFSI